MSITHRYVSCTLVLFLISISETSYSSESFNTLNAVTFGNNTFIAVGSPAAVYQSKDGTTWKESNTSGLKDYFDLNDVAWDGKQFIAVGFHGYVSASENGDTWKYIDLKKKTDYKPHADFDSINSICCNRKSCLLASNSQFFWKDLDSNWRAALSPVRTNEAFFVKSMVANDNIIIASSYPTYLTKDGKKWIELKEFYGAKTMLWDGTKFVAIFNQSIKTSKNGKDWRLIIESPIFNDIEAVAGNQNKYVAVGKKGLIIISDDLKEWRTVKSITTLDLVDVVWAKNRFVAVGNSTVGKGYDEKEVSETSTSTTIQLHYHGKSVVQSKGTIITSEDGIHWSDGILLAPK